MDDRTRALLADAHASIDRLRDALAESRAAARRELSGALNQSVRRLRSFESQAEWGRALVDATQGFCDRAVLFLREGGALRWLCARNVTNAGLPDVPLASAPAFAGAVDTRDTLVALRSKSELSDPIAAAVGEEPGRKFYVFPVVHRDNVAALLYADSEGQPVDAAGLELLAAFAGSVFEPRPNPAAPQNGLVKIEGVAPRPAAESPWTLLTREEQDLHLRAQRFARVRMAEIRLHKDADVKNGRAEQRLYTSLKADIDSAREMFRRDFLSASKTMVDYVHVELVRTLANDNVALLGSDYPGPLVHSHAY